MKEINKNETQNLLQAHDKMFYYLHLQALSIINLVSNSLKLSLDLRKIRFFL
jgi:hypothetical protein